MAFTINRRYSVRRDITGDGSSSRVLLVDDALRGGRPCALKLLRPLEGRDLAGARREFETLRGLRHPFIAEVFDFGRVEEVAGPALEAGETDETAKPGDFFITFSYVDGLNLRDAFLRLFHGGEEEAQSAGAAPGEEPPTGNAQDSRWRIFYEALAEIALGLHAIHSRGLVHRDIKPQNLLLAPCGRGAIPERFDVKIIDLDLAEPETTPLGTRLVGTLPFIAPEVLSGEFADQKSDLYSLGISIIWAISGRSPFAGTGLEEVSRAIQSGAMADLRETCPGAPDAILAVIARLVRRRSDERIPSAIALVSELERIGGFSRLAHPRARADIPTVGWERELALFAAEIETFSLGEAAHSLLLIESDPTCFTDHLMAEVEAAAQLKGVAFITGRARSPALYPYHPFSEGIQKLLPRLQFSSPRYDRFREALSLFVPGGTAAAGARPAGVFDLVEEKRRLFDAVTEFLIEAGREAPIILCLRGLERSDGETLELLEFLARNISLLRRDPEEEALFAGSGDDHPSVPPLFEPGSRLLLIAQCEAPPLTGSSDSARTASPSTCAALAEISSQPWALKIPLKPLPQERIADWISLRCPGHRPPAKLLQKIWEKCAGSPRLLDEILRRICHPASKEEGEELETVLKLPDSFQDASMERLDRMGEADRFLLDLLAVAHAPVAIRVLGRLVGRDLDGGPREEPGMEAEVSARARRLAEEGFLSLREGPEGLEAGWAVEALREHLYRQLPEEKRLHHHRSLLEVLLPERDPPRPGTVPEEIAFHAHRSGALPLFFRLAIEAAEGYRRAHSTEPAIRLLEEVLGSLEAFSEAQAGEGDRAGDLSGAITKEGLRWALNRDLGEIHRQRREYSRALEKYAVLLSLEEKGSNLQRRSEVYRRMGEIYCENRDPANAIFFLEKSLATISDLPPSREGVETLLAMAEFHLGRGQLQRAQGSAERGIDVLQRLRAPDLRFRAYSLLASLAMKQNDQARGLAMNLRTLEEVRGLGNQEHAMEVCGAVGESYVALGEYEKATESFQQGIEIAQKIGAKHLLSVFLNQLGTIHFNQADHHGALELFRKSLHLRRELGDLKGIATSYNNLGLVFRLRDDLTRASECYKRSIDIFSRLEDQSGMAAGMNNLANILELEGKYNEALEYSFRSLDKRKRFNSKPGMAFSYYRIGKIYQSKGELEKAFSFAEKGLAIRREIGEKMGIAYSHVQLAELYLLSGRVLEAHRECQQGQMDFEQIENDLGRIVAREILARVLIQVGALDEASEVFRDTLARARDSNQQLLVGAALMGLARIGIERGDFREAEAHLGRAGDIFRENRNRREHAEALLLSCALNLEMDQPTHAAEVIEDAYGILEELGIRDLVPWYFLLRGRIERCVPGGSTEKARKFLERGLVEAREVHLPDLAWLLHLELALLLGREGERALARDHSHEAEEILAAQFEPLPPHLRERFYETRMRRELKRLGRELATLDPGGPPLRAAPSAPAVAGEGQRQIEEIQSLNKKLLKLQEVSQAITSELELKRLLEKLMDAVMELVKAQRGFLILRAPEGDKETITVARNIGGEMVDGPEPKISRSISQEVIRTARPVLTTSALADERFLDSKSIHDLKLQSILCVPLVLHDQVLGVIYLDNRLRKQAFGEDDLRVLETFSAQAAIAITNARLSEELKLRNSELIEANRQMEVLNQKLLRQVNERTAELKAAREHLQKRQSEAPSSWYFHSLVGKSKRMQEIFHILNRISGTALPVLIQGESGTGKELIASAIHRSSQRHDQRFISENCAALSETILESELFGHTRGAFTGAVAERKGLFELAHGGTLVLDEVGDMSLSMQKKLLRVLEEGEIRRVGGKDTIQVDVRIISASNQDLKSLVKAGKFREDLFYRLNGIRIEIPPLRERREDIPILIQHFLEQIAQESRQPLKSISPEALRLLLSYDWPGNVRELRHFLERTVLLATGTCIEERECLFDQVIFREESRALSDGLFLDLEKLPLRAARGGFMKHYIERSYEENGRNVTHAARACGISRESFHRLLKKFKLRGAAG